jgi:hypothetical protein
MIRDAIIEMRQVGEDHDRVFISLSELNLFIWLRLVNNWRVARAIQLAHDLSPASATNSEEVTKFLPKGMDILDRGVA